MTPTGQMQLPLGFLNLRHTIRTGQAAAFRRPASAAHKSTSSKAAHSQRSAPTSKPPAQPKPLPFRPAPTFTANRPPPNTAKPSAIPSTPPATSTLRQPSAASPAAKVTPTTPLLTTFARAKTRGYGLGTALRAPSKGRAIILALGVAGIAVFGAYYGAGLKMRKEAWDERRRVAREVEKAGEVQAARQVGDVAVVEAAERLREEEGRQAARERAERIRTLEGTRGRLVYAKEEVERKVVRLDERIREGREKEEVVRRGREKMEVKG